MKDIKILWKYVSLINQYDFFLLLIQQVMTCEKICIPCKYLHVKMGKILCTKSIKAFLSKILIILLDRRKTFGYSLYFREK